MTDRTGLILLTGLPGVGKTTLIRKVCEDLSKNHKILCNGFYTEEVRNPNNKARMGFDVVTLNNIRGILSRANSSEKGPLVGKYCVYVKDFEDIALPLIKPSIFPEVLVIDEVGKMELKSKKFEMYVERCIMRTILLATIPYNVHKTLYLVKKLKNHPKAEIIVVTKENRCRLQHGITEKILRIFQNN